MSRPQSLSSEALLGRCLTGTERQSHEVIRHLADYVLIWAGEQGDDIAKSPHMARIAASVYPDVCPDDPLCSQFVLERKSREPSEMMRRSLLWRLYAHGGNATAHPELFQEAYTSKYGLVRIFKAPRACVGRSSPGAQRLGRVEALGHGPKQLALRRAGQLALLRAISSSPEPLAKRLGTGVQL